MDPYRPPRELEEPDQPDVPDSSGAPMRAAGWLLLVYATAWCLIPLVVLHTVRRSTLYEMLPLAVCGVALLRFRNRFLAWGTLLVLLLCLGVPLWVSLASPRVHLWRYLEAIAAFTPFALLLVGRPSAERRISAVCLFAAQLTVTGILLALALARLRH